MNASCPAESIEEKSQMQDCSWEKHHRFAVGVLVRDPCAVAKSVYIILVVILAVAATIAIVAVNIPQKTSASFCLQIRLLSPRGRGVNLRMLC